MKDIVEKADLAVANLTNEGGYLNDEQQAKFLEIVINEPTIVNQVRVVTMNSPKKKIEKIGFGSRILRAAPAAGTALASGGRARPDLDLITMTTSEVIAEIWLPYDVLEDNIERAGLEDTIMGHIARRSALDIEELLIKGDTGSSDSYLALMDGILELTPSANRVNASMNHDIDKTLFKKAIQFMPVQFLRNRSLMRYFVSPHAEMEFRDSVANRQTSLGDEKVGGYTPMFAYGIPVLPAALMPDNKLWLSYPNNVILGIQRQINIETARDIRRRVLVIVLTLRLAIALEQPDASIMLEGFTDAGLPSTSSTTTTTAP